MARSTIPSFAGRRPSRLRAAHWRAANVFYVRFNTVAQIQSINSLREAVALEEGPFAVNLHRIWELRGHVVDQIPWASAGN